VQFVKLSCLREQLPQKTVVIKGFETLDDTLLKDAVTRFLSTELHIQATIVNCKRLGRPAAGKVQPLLVVLSSVDEANRILSVAKELRQSFNSYTAQCIYIGPNLTASEALAEYQLRCRRRQRAADKQAQLVSAAAVDNRNSHTSIATPAIVVGPAPPLLPSQAPSASSLLSSGATADTAVKIDHIMAGSSTA